MPASKMIRVPPQETSTQAVLPPKAMWFAVGQAMLPRTPQNFSLKLTTPSKA
ncbi:MAG: hypothetical protein ACE5H8_09985 [Alphaproteobacteria bacterium]